jgi:hypothetical protein
MFCTYRRAHHLMKVLFNKTGSVHINVTLRRLTIVAVEKQKVLHIPSMYV